MNGSQATKKAQYALELLELAITVLREEQDTENFPRADVLDKLERAHARFSAASDPEDRGFEKAVLTCNAFLDDALALIQDKAGLSPGQMQSIAAARRAQALLTYIIYQSDAGEPAHGGAKRYVQPIVLKEIKPVPPAGAKPDVQPVILKKIQPVAPRGVERRKHPRVELTAEVTFEGRTNFYVGFPEDISSGGLFVSTYDIQPIGTEIAISFTLPNGRAIHAQGQVRWVRDTVEPDEDSTPGMGVMFENLSPEDREAIDEFIRSRSPIFYDE